MSNTIHGAGLFTHSYARALTEMRRSFDDLNLQLATGQRSPTYGGLGADRGLSLALRGKLSALDSYKSNIDQLSLRTSVMTTSLSSLSKIGAETRSDLDPTNYLLVDNTRTVGQQAALTRLDTAVEALNMDVAGVYLFGGRSVTTRPVASAKEILDGVVGQSGLRTVAAERRAADLGADGRGRLSFNAQSVGNGLAAGAAGNLTNTGTGGAGYVGEGSQLSITVGMTTANFTISNGGTNTLTDLANAINADGSINGGVTASVVDGQLKLSADSPDGTFTVSGAAAAELGISSPAYDPDTSVRIGEDFAGSPFGFKISGIETNIAGATASGPSGVPPHLEITLAAQPAAGDTVRLALGLPDGSTEEITLRATTSTAPGPGEFTIGATLDATVGNLRAAMDTAVQKTADTALVAASAIAASRNFFGDPPLRVSGTPATATELVDGTSTTLAWYRGEDEGGSPRQTQVARIDSTITADYGARANEDGIRILLENLGAVGVMQLDTSDPSIGKAQYAELVTRVRPELASDTGLGPLEAVVVDIANVAASVRAAKERHKTSAATLETMLANVESVSKEEVAASLLALQTNLQASYQVTAMASQLTLVNFL